MATLILTRHAQASLGKQDYDQLSDLGHKQAHLLGEYFDSTSIKPSRVICGSLKRHIETADAITRSLQYNQAIETDPRWNEFDFKGLIKAYLSLNSDQAFNLSRDSNPATFFKLLKKAMFAWANNDLVGLVDEAWSDFEYRIETGLEAIRQQADRDDTVMLVSSGGAISMAIRKVMGLSVEQMIDINFQIKNASYASFDIKRDRMVLSGFNHTPHLELDEGKTLISYA